MSIQWRDEMAVDHGVIDHDHQTLIGIINDFIDAGRASYDIGALQQILDKLDRYATIHFSREESLQRAAHYAFLDAHHHEHLDLVRQLEAKRARLKDLGDRADAAEADIRQAHAEISTLLHDWLVEHIVKSDLRMKPYAKAMAAHAQGLRPLSQSVVEPRPTRYLE